jgi:hypothetical protein
VFERLTASPSLVLLRTEFDKAVASEGRTTTSQASAPQKPVGQLREQILHGAYERLRRVHKATIALTNIVQADGPEDQSKVEGDRRRLQEHEQSWNALQEFQLVNGLYLGEHLDHLVSKYMAGVIKAVAGWNAGRQSRGNVYDWANAFNGLKVLGETILEEIFREIRTILGIDKMSSDATKS